MIPILNHLAYLQAQGSSITGSHSSNPLMKLFYFSCGCVVTAECCHDIKGLYKHRTAPCKEHNILRSHNYTFPEIQAQINCNGREVEVNGHKYDMCAFLEVNYWRLNPTNIDAVPISDSDYAAIANLPVNATHTYFIGENATIVKRIY